MHVAARGRVECGSWMTFATLALTACATFSRGGSTPSYPLVVTNHSDFEVVVYAIPSEGGGPMRIGNALSLAKTTMSVPRNALQPTDVLVLRCHSIGSANDVGAWTSPSASLDSSVVAELEIRADIHGNLTRSTLYTELVSLSRRP